MKKSVGILLVVLAAVMVITGCGSSGSNGSSVEGVYKAEAGEDTVVLTLKADNTGTFSLSEDLEGLAITYKVKGDSVVLTGPDGKELGDTGTFTIVDEGLRDFAGNLYMKQ
ncbi:MAG: hypothetical protein KKF41_02610 [Actinobacteria bacterium]|nr:hypothetical protein [Actinomycetota bacterium]MBU1943524.1 hypothetical protein [Actinomycetota bacterium]MBU2686459.1 hypothetical protein [Actinomycetota bacterium]